MPVATPSDPLAGASDALAIQASIERLCDFCIANELIQPSDYIWAYNRVCASIGLDSFPPSEAWMSSRQQLKCPDRSSFKDYPIEAELMKLAAVGAAHHKDDDTASGKDRIAMHIIGELMPRPSEVQERFFALLRVQGSRAACDYLYQLSCASCYVHKEAIERNLEWISECAGQELEMTINLSKPEKDPKEIALAGKAKKTDCYPACQLCIQNEGFAGRSPSAKQSAHPARTNLRIMPLTLGGESWGFQYSPYAYFSEHGIVMSCSHRPMHIDRQAFSNLLEFVDMFPDYMIGSNADLPIVGGSILSHDHYQCGKHVFPIMHAKLRARYTMGAYPQVALDELIWPVSCIRLVSTDRSQLLDAATSILASWRSYSDESLGIVAHTTDEQGNVVPHNTITPIVRKLVDSAADTNAGNSASTNNAATYEMYLALRCNICSDKHPLGVFHPHEQYHHIKKENIGIIEVMGLAILPARLKRELLALTLLFKTAYTTQMTDDEFFQRCFRDPEISKHATWAKSLKPMLGQQLQHQSEDKASCTVAGEKIADDKPGDEKSDAQLGQHIQKFLLNETAQVFWHVMECAGVFKLNDEGFEHFDDFIKTLGVTRLTK